MPMFLEKGSQFAITRLPDRSMGTPFKSELFQASLLIKRKLGLLLLSKLLETVLATLLCHPTSKGRILGPVLWNMGVLESPMILQKFLIHAIPFLVS